MLRGMQKLAKHFAGITIQAQHCKLPVMGGSSLALAGVIVMLSAEIGKKESKEKQEDVKAHRKRP